MCGVTALRVLTRHFIFLISWTLAQSDLITCVYIRTFILIDYVTIMRMFSMRQGVTNASNLMVTCPPIFHKWKNHFYEMKGDVGMSVHEKERKQEDAYTKTQTHS